MPQNIFFSCIFFNYCIFFLKITLTQLYLYCRNARGPLLSTPTCDNHATGNRAKSDFPDHWGTQNSIRRLTAVGATTRCFTSSGIWFICSLLILPTCHLCRREYWLRCSWENQLTKLYYLIVNTHFRSPVTININSQPCNKTLQCNRNSSGRK
jgi:hypothetical protein